MIQLSSDQLIVQINLLGAEVSSVKNRNKTEFIWQANKDVWPRHAPVLFPIVGKLKDNFFIYKANKYELPQHGFARDLVFDLLAHDSNSCFLQLKSNSSTTKRFPFEFDFKIKFSLEKNRLTTEYIIINSSTEVLFFSVGAHPGFNCPLFPNERFEDYYLEFDVESLIQTKLNNGLLTNIKSKIELEEKKLNLEKDLFENDALVFEGNQINSVTLCSSVSKHKITLEATGWPYFGIWTKKGTQKFICLEPWYGIADRENTTNELSKKEGMIQLEAKKEFKTHFSVIFS